MNLQREDIRPVQDTCPYLMSTVMFQEWCSFFRKLFGKIPSKIERINWKQFFRRDKFWQSCVIGLSAVDDTLLD